MGFFYANFASSYVPSSISRRVEKGFNMDQKDDESSSTDAKCTYVITQHENEIFISLPGTKIRG